MSTSHALALAFAALTLTAAALPARADIPPTGKAECEGRAAGEACEVEGQDGQCVDTRCYSARPRCKGPDCPPDDGGYDCRLCKPVPAEAASSTGAKSSSGCGCQGGMGGAGLGLGLLVLGLRRRVTR